MADPVRDLPSLVAMVEEKLGTIGERNTVAVLLATEGARLRFKAGVHELRLGALAGTSTVSEEAALQSWLRAAKRRLAAAEDPFNPHGAGPVPIERR